MRKKRLGMMVLAVIAATGAGITANSIVSSKYGAAVVHTPAVIKPAPTVEVLVARHEIQIGKSLNFEDFAWRKWPEELISPDYLVWEENANVAKKFEGFVARMPMAAGEPIIPSKIIDPKNRGGLSVLLRKGMRAVSVSVAPDTGTAGFIMPGDYVDLILTRVISRTGSDPAFNTENPKKPEKITPQQMAGKDKSQPSDAYYKKINSEKDLLAYTEERYSETILSNVRVLAIDQAVTPIKNKDNQSGGAPAKLAGTVTLEVTREQAEVISLSKNVGQLSLVLRSYADNVVEGDNRAADIIPEVTGSIGVPRDEVDRMRRGKEINLLRGSGAYSRVLMFNTPTSETDSNAETEDNNDNNPDDDAEGGEV